MFTEALLLGLSTGTYCAVFCAPVLLPFLFSQTGGLKKNTLYIVLFMLGRLAGYIIIGALLGITGTLAMEKVPERYHAGITASVYMVIGLLMLLTGIFYFAKGPRFCHAINRRLTPQINAAVLGILTGISLCPPFLAAAARVFGYGRALTGALYFVFFYLGTSVFLLPLFGIPLVGKRLNEIKIVARIATVILGVYFFLFSGVLGILKMIL